MSASQEETLARLLADLQSDDKARQLAGIRNAAQQEQADEMVLQALEHLAVHGVGAVRRAALDALDGEPSRKGRARTMGYLKPREREAIVAELEDWRERGLIRYEEAEVLIRRYDWSRKPITVEAPAPAVKPTPLPRAAPKAAAAKAAPAAPRPSLSERLLSQTASNIALYLGAFLVIGAAIILAALVEVTRLPILLGVTVLFGVGATLIKRRLPQPSYILFMVFSVLLPISANVIAQTLRLRAPASDSYWTLVFLLMTAIWGFGTSLYRSRLFSLAAFIGWALAFWRFPAILQAVPVWQLLSLILAAIGGLLAARYLRAWKDARFARPLTVAAQILTAGTLLWSFGRAVQDLLVEVPRPEHWIALALISAAAAGFYVISTYLYAAPVFAWIAAACLLPLSALVLGASEASLQSHAVGLAVWGTAFALGSEFLRRTKIKGAQVFQLPVLIEALPLFFMAASLALLAYAFERERLEYLFGILLGAGLVGAALTILRRRAAVWSVALIFGMGAYFTFFALPFSSAWEIPASYQWLVLSLLLLVPELFFGSPLTTRESWRWPPFTLGLFAVMIALLVLFTDLPVPATEGAFTLGAYALLAAAHALRLRKPWIGYLAAAAAAGSVTYLMAHYGLDVRQAGLTAMALIYFVAGALLRRRAAGWGNMLRLSGLVLGAIVTAWVFIDPGTWGRLRTMSAGFDLLVIAALFFAELYVRREDRIEAGGPLFLSLAAFLLLSRFGVNELPFHLLAFSLIWLISDMAFARTLVPRRLAIATRILGAALAAANVWALLDYGYRPGNAGEAAAIFAVYAAVFGLSAGLYRRALISLAAHAALAFAILLGLHYLRQDLWLPALTGLGTVYYAAGYALRAGRSKPWGDMLRISGFTLGAIVSLAGCAAEKPQAEWYALIAGALFVVETYLRRNSRLEVLGPALFSIAVLATSGAIELDEPQYVVLAISLVWLGADLIYHRTLEPRRWRRLTRVIGGIFAATCAGLAIGGVVAAKAAAVTFGMYAVFFGLYAWFYRMPRLAYLAAASLPLAAFFQLRALHQDHWVYVVGGISALYYAVGYLLRRARLQPQWSWVLLASGLGLGVINSASAALDISMQAAMPVAVAATLFAMEAFARRNVWLALPANLLYLWSYFLILMDLKVDQPQFFSVGAALLGMLMHYLLTRSGSYRGAFLTGMFSQLVLLGTTFVQLLTTAQLAYFIVIFFQGLAVLAYGVVIRSRSLLITPIVFIVAAVIAVIYGTLKGITTVVLIGCTGIVLLLLGIAAVMLRERIARLGERMGDWQA